MMKVTPEADESPGQKKVDMLYLVPMRAGVNSSGQSINLTRLVAVMMLKIAVVLGSMLLATAYGARWIDDTLNTWPWISLILMLLMSFVAMFVAYQIGQSTVAKLEADKPADLKQASQEH